MNPDTTLAELAEIISETPSTPEERVIRDLATELVHTRALIAERDARIERLENALFSERAATEMWRSTALQHADGDRS